MITLKNGWVIVRNLTVEELEAVATAGEVGLVAESDYGVIVDSSITAYVDGEIVMYWRGDHPISRNGLPCRLVDSGRIIAVVGKS